MSIWTKFKSGKAYSWFHFFFMPYGWSGGKKWPSLFMRRVHCGYQTLKQMNALGEAWDESCSDCEHFGEPDGPEEYGWCDFFDTEVDCWEDEDGRMNIEAKAGPCAACDNTNLTRFLYAFDLKKWDRKQNYLIWWWQKEKNWDMDIFLLKDKDIEFGKHQYDDYAYIFNIKGQHPMRSVTLKRVGDEISMRINNNQLYHNFRFRNRLLNLIPKSKLCEDILNGKAIAMVIRNTIGI